MIDDSQQEGVGRHGVRVTLENTDAVGLIHHSVVFRYMETAEVEWFRDLGIHWLEFPDLLFPRRKVEAEFLLPVRFDDLCTIETRVVQVRAAKVKLEHRFITSSGVAIVGTILFGVVTRENFSPAFIPDKMREVLEKCMFAS